MASNAALLNPRRSKLDRCHRCCKIPSSPTLPLYLHLPKANPRPCYGSRKSPPPQQAKETPAPEPKQTDEPDQPVRSNPDISEPLISAHEEPSHNKQPLPLLIAEESLERAWLRVSITTDKTRVDSIPMDQATPSSRLKRLWQGLSRS